MANGGKELRVSTKAVTAACDDEEAAHDPRHAAAPVLVLRKQNCLQQMNSTELLAA